MVGQVQTEPGIPLKLLLQCPQKECLEKGQVLRRGLHIIRHPETQCNNLEIAHVDSMFGLPSTNGELKMTLECGVISSFL